MVEFDRQKERCARLVRPLFRHNGTTKWLLTMYYDRRAKGMKGIYKFKVLKVGNRDLYRGKAIYLVRTPHQQFCLLLQTA